MRPTVCVFYQTACLSSIALSFITRRPLWPKSSAGWMCDIVCPLYVAKFLSLDIFTSRIISWLPVTILISVVLVNYSETMLNVSVKCNATSVIQAISHLNTRTVRYYSLVLTQTRYKHWLITDTTTHSTRHAVYEQKGRLNSLLDNIAFVSHGKT